MGLILSGLSEQADFPDEAGEERERVGWNWGVAVLKGCPWSFNEVVGLKLLNLQWR